MEKTWEEAKREIAEATRLVEEARVSLYNEDGSDLDTCESKAVEAAKSVAEIFKHLPYDQTWSSQYIYIDRRGEKLQQSDLHDLCFSIAVVEGVYILDKERLANCNSSKIASALGSREFAVVGEGTIFCALFVIKDWLEDCKSFLEWSSTVAA